jgi:hypothetical protein
MKPKRIEGAGRGKKGGCSWLWLWLSGDVVGVRRVCSCYRSRRRSRSRSGSHSRSKMRMCKAKGKREKCRDLMGETDERHRKGA